MSETKPSATAGVLCEPLAWIYEDELPDGYPYDAMFPHSKVDVVRMFPVFGPCAATASSSTPDTGDAELLDWMEDQARRSRTGVSLDFVRYVEEGQVLEHGFRYMSWHFQGDRKKDIRSAIRAAMAAKGAA